MKKTARGFDYTEFEDSYGNKCSLQKSSSAMEHKIWFGVNDVNPIIMASDAKRLGLNPTESTGWVKFEFPREVMFHDRMHLTQEMVHDLMPALMEFEDTGELEGGYDNDFADDYKSFSDDYEMVDFKEMSKELKNSAFRLAETIKRIDIRREKLVNQLAKTKESCDNLLDFVINKYSEDEDWTPDRE